jgi:phage baseplate assembly protein W
VARTFKSSGTQFATQRPASFQVPVIPVGIKTPMSLGGNSVSTPFLMNTTIEDQIGDNLRNLILTNHGERLGIYDFGADLGSLLTESIAISNMTQEVENRIKTAVQKYMPGIHIDGITPLANPPRGKSLASFDFIVTYSYVQAGINGRKIQINLTVAG